MKIEYSRHAEVRLRERFVSKTTVEKALVNFQKIVQLEEEKYICYYKTNNKQLVVIFTKRRGYVKIITLYYENNI